MDVQLRYQKLIAKLVEVMSSEQRMADSYFLPYTHKRSATSFIYLYTMSVTYEKHDDIQMNLV